MLESWWDNFNDFMVESLKIVFISIGIIFIIVFAGIVWVVTWPWRDQIWG